MFKSKDYNETDNYRVALQKLAEVLGYNILYGEDGRVLDIYERDYGLYKKVDILEKKFETLLEYLKLECNIKEYRQIIEIKKKGK